ncbi:hypothetical protein BH09DEP1_BH09DEP1_1260 [soil metagenome]
MKVTLLGLLILSALNNGSFAMDLEAFRKQEEEEEGKVLSKIPADQREILVQYFGKKTGTIGKLAADLARPWLKSNIPAWLEAQLQERLKKYNEQRKSIAIKAFMSAGVAGVSAYVCSSNQTVKPELKAVAAGLMITSAGYSLSNIYDYCVAACPTQEMIVQEIKQQNQSRTDDQWRQDLIRDIGCKYALIAQVENK